MNILLTSVGRRSYIVQYFKEALNGTGKVHVANSTEITPAFQCADSAVVTPLIYDKEYVSFLINYCKNQQINTIISLFDIDLPILSTNKAKFLEAGIRVIVSDIDVINTCNDKWETYQYLKRNDFPVPKTFISLGEALQEISNQSISCPLMVKPRWGMGSIAVYEAENVAELEILYEKVRRNIQNTYLKYESSADLDACVLIQEKIRGQEYGLDVINDLDGNYQNTIVKMKFAMRAGETDSAITEDNAELMKIGLRLSNTLHHVANLDVDVFITNQGPYILEMNARFGGGYPFSHMAGVNLPLAIVNWLEGKEVPVDCLRAEVAVLSMKDINIVKIPHNE